ncbi:immunoglobulin-like domain-containing protein [Salimicrobium halophilum]|uniref:Predicted extracellular nuclease n=1 Tax=Salimicrobium halophilum TaxID=86666 RepID=A0A1G8SB88_9BACI|nr:immunoglobulin-like domain-containing protein [Salimicrobium halophilum]SDJ26482.1 Predicted extracellular nuclease [Salimicrobium halophilum]
MKNVPGKVLATSVVAAAVLAPSVVQADEMEVEVTTIVVDDDGVLKSVDYDEVVNELLDGERDGLYSYIMEHDMVGIGVNDDTIVDFDAYIDVLVSSDSSDEDILQQMIEDGEYLFTEEEEASVTPWNGENLAPHDIQGAGHFSPYEGEEVNNVKGVVTHNLDQGYFPKGFYIQSLEEDGDIGTSEGLFVVSDKEIEPGTVVSVSGMVEERKPDLPDYMSTETQMTTTQVAATEVMEMSTGADVPEPVTLAEDRPQPDEIDNDELTSFDPEEDAIDYYESMEGMRVDFNNPTISSPIDYSEVAMLPEGADVPETKAGGARLTEDDKNPERIIVDLDGYVDNDSYPATVGDTMDGSITGIVDYDFGNFQVLATEAPPELNQQDYQPGATELTRDSGKLNVATYNIENFTPEDAGQKANRIAESIADNMKQPDVIGLVEVQDNTGNEDDGTVSGEESAQTLIDAIEAAGGPTYEYSEIPPVDNAEGGEPGGNIRVGFLYNPDRVSLKDGAEKGGSEEAVAYENGDLTLNPGRVAPNSDALQGSRIPLAAEFTFQGEDVVVVLNHFNSKSGDDPLFGLEQPPERGSEEQRHAIAEEVNGFVDGILEDDPDANVVVMGDLNDFQFSKTLDILKGDDLTNMIDTLPEDEQYTYNFTGNSQVLDHILVNNDLAGSTTADILNINSDFSVAEDRASDHDPVLAQIDFGFDGWSAEEVVTYMKENLDIGYKAGDSEDSVTQDLILPNEGFDGTTISWSSSNEDVVTADGIVTRPETGTGDEVVTLTATITNGAEVQTEEVTLTIPEEAPAVDISEARALDGGMQAKVQGEITAINGSNYYIEDDTAGIVVYDENGNIDAEVGDVIEVQGATGAYYGQEQITVAYADSVMIAEADADALEPATVTGADIGEDTEAELVTLENVEITEAREYGEFTAVDGEGNTFIVDNEFTDVPVEVGDTLDSITGVVVYTFEEYKVAPRVESDLQ